MRSTGLHDRRPAACCSLSVSPQPADRPPASLYFPSLRGMDHANAVGFEPDVVLGGMMLPISAMSSTVSSKQGRVRAISSILSTRRRNSPNPRIRPRNPIRFECADPLYPTACPAHGFRQLWSRQARRSDRRHRRCHSLAVRLYHAPSQIHRKLCRRAGRYTSPPIFSTPRGPSAAPRPELRGRHAVQIADHAVVIDDVQLAGRKVTARKKQYSSSPRWFGVAEHTLFAHAPQPPCGGGRRRPACAELYRPENLRNAIVHLPVADDPQPVAESRPRP